MNAETIVTVLCGVAIAVGVVGTIIRVLPGSILIGLSLLAWAIWGGAGTTGWVIFGIGAVCVLAGMTSSAVLAGRKLKQHSIPNRSVLAGIVLGIVGMFGCQEGVGLERRCAQSHWFGDVGGIRPGLPAASTWVVGVWVVAVTG